MSHASVPETRRAVCLFSDLTYDLHLSIAVLWVPRTLCWNGIPQPAWIVPVVTRHFGGWGN